MGLGYLDWDCGWFEEGTDFTEEEEGLTGGEGGGGVSEELALSAVMRTPNESP